MLNNTEIFTTPAGKVMIVQDSKVIELQQNNECRDFITEFMECMEKNYKIAHEALREYYKIVLPNYPKYRYMIVSRFIRCNMGEMDTLKRDIDKNGKFHFEEVKCPLRGECKLENVCCKPQFTSTLSEREMQVLQLMVKDGLSSEGISRKLCISKFTADNHRRHIHAKTKTKTPVELAGYFYENNLEQ